MINKQVGGNGQKEYPAYAQKVKEILLLPTVKTAQNGSTVKTSAKTSYILKIYAYPKRLAIKKQYL